MMQQLPTRNQFGFKNDGFIEMADDPFLEYGSRFLPFSATPPTMKQESPQTKLVIICCGQEQANMINQGGIDVLKTQEDIDMFLKKEPQFNRQLTAARMVLPKKTLPIRGSVLTPINVKQEPMDRPVSRKRAFESYEDKSWLPPNFRSKKKQRYNNSTVAPNAIEIIETAPVKKPRRKTRKSCKNRPKSILHCNHCKADFYARPTYRPEHNHFVLQHKCDVRRQYVVGNKHRACNHGCSRIKGCIFFVTPVPEYANGQQ